MIERGYFRDKVRIITLDKTPSMTHFRSHLFKEVEGSYDLESFCESLKISKTLFILEKCDNMFRNFKERFIEDLNFIVENCAYVNFLMITNDSYELDMKFNEVWMREFRPLDASKLLCKTSYEYLNCLDRNVYNLAKHKIFELVPKTPQGIWSLSEKLKRGKTLDDIVRDIEIEKSKNDNTDDELEMNDSIKDSLE